MTLRTGGTSRIRTVQEAYDCVCRQVWLTWSNHVTRATFVTACALIGKRAITSRKPNLLNTLAPSPA